MPTYTHTPSPRLLDVLPAEPHECMYFGYIVNVYVYMYTHT